MSTWLARLGLGRARGGASADPGDRASGYAQSWDHLARHDALNAICDGADEDRFEAWGREHGTTLRRLIEPGSRVLDFGCGIGRLETYLAPYCREMHGVDVSAEMLARARQRLGGAKNVHLHQLTAPQLPMFGDGFFDFAFAMLVFHHLAKQDTFLVLREFGRVLRPGGRFFANFPNLLTERYGTVFEDYALRRERAAHRVRPYTPEELRWLLDRVRVNVVELTVGEEIEVLGTFKAP
jgi:ubiquinone/menaquinone biosynthesis C-methylase UbiE